MTRLFVATVILLISNTVFSQTTLKLFEYFPENYEQARQNFRNEADIITSTESEAKFFSFKIPSQIDDDLTTDVLYIPAKQQKNLLILSSGVHGIEGFVGHAIQIMFIKTFLSENLITNTGILFIHAVNPYGFKYIRRVSENNIDLNRNSSANDSLYDIVNEGYPHVSDFINPTSVLDFSDCMHKCFFLRAMNMLRKESISVLRQAVLQGQYAHPKGLYYGGNDFEPQIKLLTPFIDSICEPYQTIMTIDLHTGYGERGKLHLFPNPVEDNIKVLAEEIFEGYQIDWGDGDDFYTVTGDFSGFIGQLNADKTYIPITFEYGTMNSQKTTGSIKSLHIMVMENQGFQYGYKSSKDSVKIKDKFIEMYYPSSSRWRNLIMIQTIEMFETILPRFMKK